MPSFNKFPKFTPATTGNKRIDRRWVAVALASYVLFGAGCIAVHGAWEDSLPAPAPVSIELMCADMPTAPDGLSLPGFCPPTD